MNGIGREVITTKRSHKQHEGEVTVQVKRNTPEQLAQQIPDFIETEMPRQHADFYNSLTYLPLSTLDEQGRPWASILVTKSVIDPSVGIIVSSDKQLSILAQMNSYDPFVRAIKQHQSSSSDKGLLFAGVGVDFTNRRRNKIAGTISFAEVDESGETRLNLHSDAHLGNCPKYITVRSLIPHPRQGEVLLDQFGCFNDSFPMIIKELINKASTVFLATKHIPQGENIEEEQVYIGLNHRGGTPGFVRTYEESDNSIITTYLVLPDYSGNRFYQSLGNVESGKLVGLTIPDFLTGDMLYVTGVAENLFDHDAQKLMPRMNLVTRIRITGAVYIKEALSLRMISDEQFSPYNPPLRYLRGELEDMGLSNESESSGIKATLISVQKITNSISTFSFQLSAPVDVSLPGGFGIFDFSEYLNHGYKHMDIINPQAVNEDYTRTWTLSSAASFNIDKQKFNSMDLINITVKRKPNGLVSNFLHEESDLATKDQALVLALKGVGGVFSCFYHKEKHERPCIPDNMLWIAGGVGVTPFMSMWDAIVNMGKALSEVNTPFSTNIVFVFAGRDDDLALLKHFLKDLDTLPKTITITILGYQSLGEEEDKAHKVLTLLSSEYPKAPIIIKQKRLQMSELSTIENLSEREVFLCGPESFMDSAQDWLQQNAKDTLGIHRESYSF